ncbi:thioesterase family protein [Nitratireductor kimnyeongensis]|uniref:Thioesterase family protein n=1 Tax=Nitratireductor kimnyeongensis TaxID=430679 RepID=A0ABW0TA54_9HYPH|nr:thioesterase family protein [Nitratireductor kimnyeongensis]QZZ35905.1 thioesterase family protein [Nitratireductor kimnyeongensis]
MPDEARYCSSVFELQKDWIDFNGHLNMAYYTVLFDRAYEEVSEEFGMGARYAAERRLTTYTAEIHLCYLRELHLEDRVRGTFQLLDHDEKRLHSYQELRHAEEGWLAATCETLTLHVDMSGPRVTPFPADVLGRIETMHGLHKSLPLPEQAGRSIAIRRRTR